VLPRAIENAVADGHCAENNFIKKVVAWLTEHDNVITKLLRGAQRLALALGPAPAGVLLP